MNRGECVNEETAIYKTRGKFYNSTNQMCSQSYTNLNCSNSPNGISPEGQLFGKLLQEYHKNSSNLYRFGDFSAFSRSIIGDEGTEFLRDALRTRSGFKNINAYSFMELVDEKSKLQDNIYYPIEGMSQFPKRMMYNATMFNGVQLYLNEEVISIDDNTDGSCYPFVIETSRYSIRAKQLISAIDPFGWQNITGSIARDIKADEHFQVILPIQTVTIQCYWPNRWWEETNLFPTNFYRALSRQNCISAIEFFSQHPEQREQNLTRAVYDDGQCVDMWSNLTMRSSEDDLIEEILRGLGSIFIDVQIPRPKKIFTKIWLADWYFQIPNSVISNKNITRWALNPLTRFNRNQFSLVGEGFFLDRSAWTEGAIKSSLISLTSQFNITFNCYENDFPSGGRFCASNFV